MRSATCWGSGRRSRPSARPCRPEVVPAWGRTGLRPADRARSDRPGTCVPGSKTYARVPTPSREDELMSSRPKAEIEAKLRSLAAERILVLDGAMGTMIQGLGLDESGYRGARFADWRQSLKGNNDLLSLTQ